MDKTKYAFIGILVILAITVMLGNPTIINAEGKCFPIYVRSHAGIEPESLNIEKGNCVVWINWTRGEDIRIIFRDGKKCADMTKAPVKFKPDFNGCYLTEHLGFGETASLLFVAPGKFDYEVEFGTVAGGLYGASRTPLLGSIVVK
jgi:hypothetical protein